MKNSDEWISDIESKLQERYKKRDKRQKVAVCISTCSVVLVAVIAMIYNKSLSSFENNIIIENSEHYVTKPEDTEAVLSETEKAAFSEAKNSDNSSLNTEKNEETSSNVTESINTETPLVSVQVNCDQSKPEESHKESPVTIQSTASIPEEPVTSDIHVTIPEEPVTEPENIVQLGFKVNKINNQISAAPKYYSPESYDTFNWSYDEITGYYGIDYRSALNEIDFNTDEYNEYRIITDKSGNMACDKVNFLYNNSDGSSIKLSASKILLPYDCIYELESNETNSINGTDVLIGGWPTSSNSENYSFFYADFKKNDINYRFIGNNISGQQFYEAIEKYISK